MKTLREYIIVIEIPEGKKLSGFMPFDASISENQGRFKVFASSKEEAEEKVQQFLNK